MLKRVSFAALCHGVPQTMQGRHGALGTPELLLVVVAAGVCGVTMPSPGWPEVWELVLHVVSSTGMAWMASPRRGVSIFSSVSLQFWSGAAATIHAVGDRLDLPLPNHQNDDIMVPPLRSRCSSPVNATFTRTASVGRNLLSHAPPEPEATTAEYDWTSRWQAGMQTVNQPR